MNIANTPVGQDERPYFIAEAGVNHNGQIDLARDLIDTAADAGADAVKFQTFSADRLVTHDAAKAEYQADNTGEGSQYEMLKQYELDRGAHERLRDYCADVGITFLSTPFDTDSADLLAELGVPAIKVGSGELDNHPLLKHIAGLGCPMIVSTGMAIMEEIHAAHDVIQSVDPDIDLVFLHCTSAYPTAIEDVNLRAMQTMDEELSVPIGLSDHTTLPDMPALAVAAGACVVEKHFTLDSTLPGPDHEASLEPEELKRAVSLAKTASTARGSPAKQPTQSERGNIEQVRKGLYAASDLPEGTNITADHVTVMRPATGLSPRLYDAVLGRTTTKAIHAGEPLTVTNVDIDPSEVK